MPSSSDYLKLMEIYRRLDNCHDYRIIDKYIEVIKNVSNDCPHPEFSKLLGYAKKRRVDEFNIELMAIITID